MKIIKISFLFLCLCILNSYAQDNNVLYNEIQQAKSSGETFASVSALTLVNRNITQNQKIEDNFFNSQEVYFLHYNKLATKNLTRL